MKKRILFLALFAVSFNLFALQKIHFSVDDVIGCFENLTRNENRYDSAFDEPFLAYIKSLHEKYNARVSLYCFYEKEGFLEMGVSPIKAPDMPTYITLDFEKGVPVALNDEKMTAKNIILKLNEIGGANGIGIIDIVENRLVGMKCRGVYETPGGTILYKAHSLLESVCLDKMTMHEKQRLSITFAELVYNGQWFTPLREALSAFDDKTQEPVTGKVKLKLYKGNIIPAGIWSDYSLYSEEIATFGESDYDQKDSAGFINLYGLPIKVQAMVNAKNKK